MRNNTWGWVVITLIVLFMVTMVIMQLTWADECAALGGDYVRQWNGWPTCIR